MESQTGQPVSPNPWSWDWSRSLWTAKPVSETVNARVWTTLGIMAIAGIFSLLLACLLLFAGMLISRVTDRPPWLAKTSGILRLVLVSAGVSAPFLAWETLVIVYPSLWLGWTSSALFTAGLLVSVLPAWLLVQYGHGEISACPENAAPFAAQTWRRLAPRLSLRLLKLVGAIAVLTVLAEQNYPIPGLGRTFVDAVNRRDFTLLFAIVWAFVILVVLIKLAADLIEIGYSSRRRFVQDTLAAAPLLTRLALPRWVPIACLALVAVSLTVAVAAPAIAPHYGDLGARLLPPSSQHVLGTDHLGRDVFSRLIFGIRVDILFGLIVVGIASVLAVGWVALGARVRRSDDWRDDTREDLVMLPRDVLYSAPWLVLLLFLASLVGTPASALLITFSPGLVLLPRAVAMMQEAYRSSPDGRPWLKSVLMSIAVTLLFAVAGAILFISAASYLGFGVQPPAPELGGLLSGPARRYMLQAPWMALWPSVTLILLMLVFVMAGEALLERFGFRSKAVWSKVWE